MGARKATARKSTRKTAAKKSASGRKYGKAASKRVESAMKRRKSS